MWITLRKPGLGAAPVNYSARLRNISNALTGKPSLPRPRHGACLVDRTPARLLPLLNTTVTRWPPCRLTYVGPPAADGVSQINAVLPENLRTAW